MQSEVSTHKTGLPDRLLRLFTAREPLPYLPPIVKKPPKLPYSGVAQYLEHFATPDDPEYEPPAPETRPSEPRIFRSPEFAVQSRIDVDTKPER
jgi:U1 small nuclear ribonucleoprotein